MNTKDLSALALRLYCQKSETHKQLVHDLFTEYGPSYVSKDLRNDVDTLLQLKAAYGGLYCDLWTDAELKSMKVPYTTAEHTRYMERVPDAIDIEVILQRAIEARDRSEQEKVERYDNGITDPQLLRVLELRDLLEYKSSDKGVSELMSLTAQIKYNDTYGDGLADGETVENDGQQDHNDGETLDNDHSSDTEPSAVLTTENIPTPSGTEKPKAQQPTNSRPLKRETTSKKPKVLNRQLKPRQRERHITGQDKQLNNNVRLWESDNTEVKVYW